MPNATTPGLQRQTITIPLTRSLTGGRAKSEAKDSEGDGNIGENTSHYRPTRHRVKAEGRAL